MAQTAGGPWLTVGKVIECFVGMGCSPQEFPGDSVEPFGQWQVYYLEAPDGEGFVSLVGYDLTDRISPLTVQSWERALGIKIPKGL